MRIRRAVHVHDPERDAAMFVQGEMPERSCRRFESHLVGCEQCWKEVEHGRAGRAVAERGRELSPPGLREDIRAAVALSKAPGRRRVGILIPVVAAALAGLVVSGLLVRDLLSGSGPVQPKPIAAALASFRSDQATATGATLYGPPDLSAAGLQLVGSGRSSLGGMVVDAFWFASGGTKVVLFLSTERFPEAIGAQERAGAVHGWRAADDGVHLVCADSPVSYLLMSRDGFLVQRAEVALRHQTIPRPGD